MVGKLQVKQNCSRCKFLSIPVQVAANPELEPLNNNKKNIPFIVSTKICAIQTESLSREKGK